MQDFAHQQHHGRSAVLATEKYPMFFFDREIHEEWWILIDTLDGQNPGN